MNNTTAETDVDEVYSVYRHLMDGGHERLKYRVSAREALQEAHYQVHSSNAIAGLTQRVTIVDRYYHNVFDWMYGQGIVLPKGYR